MSNVGVVIDLAVHDIDLIRWFTDSDIVEVQPQLSSAVAEREDIALLQKAIRGGDGDTLHKVFARSRHIRRGIVQAKQA